MPNQKQQHKSLREACIDEAYRIIEAEGVQSLSMREVARRLKVSHQAPYKHFQSKEHILAALVAKCFDDFSDHLEGRQRHDNAWDDLGEMGQAYLSFARENPLKYRLMFNSPLPPASQHPEMLEKANRAFSILEDRLASMSLVPSGAVEEEPARHDAMFIWCTLHGMASIMQSDILPVLDLPERQQEIATQNAFARLGRALGET